VTKARKSASLNKKGELFDGIMLIVMFVMIVILGIVVFKAADGIFQNSGFRENMQGVSGGTGNVTLNKWDTIYSGGGLDNMFLIFYFVGHAGILALGALLPNKSIFFAINIMIFGAALLLSSFMRTLMTELLNAFALTGVSKDYYSLYLFSRLKARVLLTSLIMFR